MEFESYTQKETHKTDVEDVEFRIDATNKIIQRETESLNFLHSLVGESKENAQNILDELRTKKDELLKKQQETMTIGKKTDSETYNELENDIKPIDKKITEIFEVTKKKDPKQITEEEFEAGLNERQSLVIKNLEQRQSELASLERKK